MINSYRSELLEVDGSVSVHMRNNQYLAIEIFRVSRKISRYNLRQISGFSRPLVKSEHHGRESVSFLGPKIWDMLPDDCKDIDNLKIFKNKVKKMKPENCPCRLCKVYVHNISFV